MDNELELLRAFYEAWEALHRIPHDDEHREQSVAQAGVLVEAAHALRALKGGQNG